MKELMCKKAAMKINIDNGSILSGQAGDKILKLMRNTRKTYKLNSAREIGLPAAASSSNKALAFCK